MQGTSVARFEGKEGGGEGERRGRRQREGWKEECVGRGEVERSKRWIRYCEEIRGNS